MILVVSIHFLRISKLEFVSLVQKGSIILFPIISKQARAIKKKQKEEVPRNQKEQRCQEQTGI